MSSITASSSRRGAWTAMACAALLAMFAALAWFAVETKCATFDEPLHATSAYLSTFYSEYRVDSEDPPLWKYWAMIPHSHADLFIERQGKSWDWAIDEPRNQSMWAGYILFRTTTIDGAAFLQSSRAMFLALGVILGGVIAFWTFRLFGPVACIVATALFAVDPTFLAHAPLVKNDVCITLLMLLFIIALYQAGQRVTWLNLLGLSLCLGAALSVKYSAILLGPMMLLALLIRIALPAPWIVLGRALSRRSHRFLAAIGIGVVAVCVSWPIIWACYRFRFDASADGGRLNTTDILHTIAENRFYLHEHRWPKNHESDGWEVSLPVRAALFTERHRLLPQSWIAGFLFTYSSTLVRPAFLMGRFYDTGCWYYFPLVLLFKMPLATLVMMIAAAGWALVLLIRRRLIDTSNAWLATCLAVPILIYGASAVGSNLNLGIRHLLPMFPFIFILLGALASRLHQARRKMLLVLAAVLALALAIETFAAFPDFISFFNVAAGGKRGGLELLSDSNLDWGQDVPALAVWQQKHPIVPLYALCFSRVDPEFYDIKHLPTLDGPCVLAISATTLQGIYLHPGQKNTFRPLWHVEPMEVLDGTIYLYRFPEDMPSPKVIADIRELLRSAQSPGTTSAERRPDSPRQPDRR